MDIKYLLRWSWNQYGFVTDGNCSSWSRSEHAPVNMKMNSLSRFHDELRLKLKFLLLLHRLPRKILNQMCKYYFLLGIRKEPAYAIALPLRKRQVQIRVIREARVLCGIISIKAPRSEHSGIRAPTLDRPVHYVWHYDDWRILGDDLLFAVLV